MRTRMYGGVRGQGLAAPIYSIDGVEKGICPCQGDAPRTGSEGMASMEDNSERARHRFLPLR